MLNNISWWQRPVPNKVASVAVTLAGLATMGAGVESVGEQFGEQNAQDNVPLGVALQILALGEIGWGVFSLVFTYVYSMTLKANLSDNTGLEFNDVAPKWAPLYAVGNMVNFFAEKAGFGANSDVPKEPLLPAI